MKISSRNQIEGIVERSQRSREGSSHHQVDRRNGSRGLTPSTPSFTGRAPAFRPPHQAPFAPTALLASRLHRRSPSTPIGTHAQRPIAFRAKRQGWDSQHAPWPCSPKRRGLSSAERWQHLRPMRDSRGLDTKRSPPWQDSRAMYPKSPDYTPKRTHGTKILPSSARKACISRERCQGGDLFCAIGEKRIHTARFLPHRPKQP